MRQDAGRLRDEWMATAGRDLPIDREALFPEGGGLFERRAAAARARLLGQLRPVLLLALEPGERVCHAARGVDRRVAAAGALFQLAAQVAIVLTDRRLLLVQVNRSGKARDVKNQVRLAEVRGAGSSFLGGFEIRLADGKKLRYASVPRRSRTTLAAALPKLERRDPRPKSAAPSVEHLCPACLKLVPGRVGVTPVCPNPACRIPFRDPARAQRLSLLVPGLGDLYLRHHLLGAFEFVVSMALLAFAVSLVAEAAAIGFGDGEAIGLLIGATFLVGIPRALSFSFTRYMARSGLVPLAERASPQALRNLPAFPPWAYALFLAGGVGLAVGVVAAQKAAGPQGQAAAARRAARAGAFDEAVALWRGVEAAGPSDETRARMAVAFYRAGDVEDGDRVGAPLAGRRLEKALADEFNGFLRRRDQAMNDYSAGLRALAKGNQAEAGLALDRPAPVTIGSGIVGDVVEKPWSPGAALFPNREATGLPQDARRSGPASGGGVPGAAGHGGPAVGRRATPGGSRRRCAGGEAAGGARRAPVAPRPAGTGILDAGGCGSGLAVAFLAAARAGDAAAARAERGRPQDDRRGGEGHPAGPARRRG